MNQKGFSLFFTLIGLFIFLFCVQFALKQYSKSLSQIRPSKVAMSQNGVKNGTPKLSFQEDVLLKTSVLPQLDNLLKEQQVFLATQGRYATDISSLSVNPPPSIQYHYGVSSNKAGWVVWTKKTAGKNKVLISKNIYTKQLCCKDIDKNACQILAITKTSCPF